jgi:hypothetical protein
LQKVWQSVETVDPVSIKAFVLISCKAHPCVFLVIPDSPYHMEVPILVGTNVLTYIINTYKEKDSFGLYLL